MDPPAVERKVGWAFSHTLDPVVDPRERDAWRGDFKRLGQLLQQSK